MAWRVARGTEYAYISRIWRGLCVMIAVVLFLLCVGTLLLFLLPDDRPQTVDDRPATEKLR
jgi:hypothetical protein